MNIHVRHKCKKRIVKCVSIHAHTHTHTHAHTHTHVLHRNNNLFMRYQNNNAPWSSIPQRCDQHLFSWVLRSHTSKDDFDFVNIMEKKENVRC